jgi:hypothetical protein
MKYFIDTEFLEGTQNKTFLGINTGKTKPTIDLISIGIVAEDGREYYAISNEFNLKEAWNRFQLKQVSGDARNRYPEGIKEYWLRYNVLKPIFYNLITKDINFHDYDTFFTYQYFKRLISNHGKSNKQIAKEIIEFVTPTNEPQFCKDSNGKYDITYQATKRGGTLPEFYGYYADYDWVVFCWLFGKMIDLPKGFPMYCKDLKQLYDEKQNIYNVFIEKYKRQEISVDELPYPSTRGKIKLLPDYPKQTNEHNALADAKWNYELYKFLESI